MTARLGYWFRFSTNGKRLHVARWQREDDGSLLVVAACGQQVKEGTAPTVPDRLILQPTAVDALRIMDSNQARHLCADCRAIFQARAA